MSEEHRPQTPDEKAEFSASGNMRWIILRGKWGLAIDTAILKLIGYSLITKQYSLAQNHRYQPTLLLTTTGARTGQKRTCGLPYWEVEGKRIVRGSNGGGPTDPHWCHNIRKNPDAEINLGLLKGGKRKVRAHVSSGAEREHLYEIMDRLSKTTSMYQDMCTPRELPLVVLEEV